MRPEIETGVADAAAFALILERLGFREAVLYEKRRELWVLDDCAIALDELPRLGWWLEIEGPTPTAVAAARDRLGLSAAPPVEDGYVGMASASGVRQPGGCVALRFDDRGPPDARRD